MVRGTGLSCLPAAPVLRFTPVVLDHKGLR